MVSLGGVSNFYEEGGGPVIMAQPQAKININGNVVSQPGIISN